MQPGDRGLLEPSEGKWDVLQRREQLHERRYVPVGYVHGRAEHLPGELSGGEMQRTAIARALAAKPRLILADEPTGNLDSATGAEILDVLCDQVDVEGTALLMVTHDADAAGRAQRMLSLRDGHLE